MANHQKTPIFVSHHAANVMALLMSAHTELSVALNLIDQSGDLICGAKVQTAIDGLDFAIAERLHNND